MDRQQARQEVRKNWESLITGILQPARQRVNGKTSYICPNCGHGTHGDGLTAVPNKGGVLKCFGCGWTGDVIDLYRQQYGADYNTALNDLAGQLGITIDPYRPEPPARERTEAARRDFSSAAGEMSHDAPKKPTEGAEAAQTADYTEYYKRCRERLNDPAAISYLQARGISKETAAAYWLGYDPAADPATAPGGQGEALHPVPRLIIPTTTGHYIARALSADVAPQYQKMNPKGGKAGIFNAQVLQRQQDGAIFVVEGWADALSVIECGGAAIALNSTANSSLLLAKLKEGSTAATLILSLDSDEPGQRAQKALYADLQKLGQNCIVAQIAGSYKDANERLQHDRAGLEAAITEAQRQGSSRPDSVAAYMDAAMADEIADFQTDIKTGFSELDRRSSGGLYTGLYVLAAISSLGKTTLAHQIADNIAAAGKHVLYFSLEQSRLEMVTKSLARITAQHDLGTAINSLAIRKGQKNPALMDAIKEYRETTADRMSIIEANGENVITTTYIKDKIEKYIKDNKVRPVVFLDYLQIIQPEIDGKGRMQSTKEAVDATIFQLRQIARKEKITVIAISSMNRANYTLPVNFEGLKESGNIEYTADCVWGLQLKCVSSFTEKQQITERRKIADAAKNANPREIELAILKNRFGRVDSPDDHLQFSYYPANDLFVENGGFTPVEPEPGHGKGRTF